MNDLIDSINSDENEKKKTFEFRHFNRQAARHHMVNEPAFTQLAHYICWWSILISLDKSKMTKLERKVERREFFIIKQRDALEMLTIRKSMLFLHCVFILIGVRLPQPEWRCGRWGLREWMSNVCAKILRMQFKLNEDKESESEWITNLEADWESFFDEIQPESFIYVLMFPSLALLVLFSQCVWSCGTFHTHTHTDSKT